MHRAAPARSSPLASPAGSLRTTPNARPQPIHLPHSTHAPNTPAIPYLLPAGLLGAYPAGSQRCVGEMVLGGLLDCVAIGAAEACISVGMGGWPRAWLGGTGDVVVQSRVQTEVAEDQYAEHAKHEQTRTRRNEAGLPTPPESSSSSGGSDDDDRSASCSPSDDGSCSDADADADATEDSHPSHISHVSAPVLGTNTHDREVLSGSGKTMSEAHFRGGASGRAGATAARTPDGPKVNLGKLDRSNKGKEKGAKRLGERVGRFWGGLRVQVRGLRLGRLGFGRGARRGRG
ncbi:hypothetical protein J132_07704 [Termitomyces sp. J132]|nr:hypothetical protein H2248_012547 [Termitomyces sp. 'cryptogamus']KNZ77043.1 hypothetical protein J132_07704 [Termitomyces sp. J132]